METFKSFISEEKDEISKDDINVVILTKIKSKKLELVSNTIFLSVKSFLRYDDGNYFILVWMMIKDFQK